MPRISWNETLVYAAARRLPAEPPDRHWPDVGEALARHLAIAYLRGVLDLTSEALVEFYRWTSARLRQPRAQVPVELTGPSRPVGLTSNAGPGLARVADSTGREADG